MRTPLGAVIKTYRSKNKVSANRLAREIGITGTRLLKIEAGGTLPGLVTLARIGQFFDWTAQDLGEYVLTARGEPSGPYVPRGQIGNAKTLAESAV